MPFRIAARRISLALISISLSLLNGCTTTPHWLAGRATHHRAFIIYWHPPHGNKDLRLAVKDNIDMQGVVTTAGSEYFAKKHLPAKHDAECLAIARQSRVVIVGKTNLSEFAVSPSGINEYFGTPKNPFAGFRRLIPGGSSSGSAEAVASGLADIAFGTDTAGSIRVPAACCGIVGLKTTFGLIPLEGVYPIEPHHLDTVGPLARDIAHTVQGMDLLQSGFSARYQAAVAAKPSAKMIRIGRLNLRNTDPRIEHAVDDTLARAGFQVIPLGTDVTAKWEQAKKDGNTVAASGAWLTNNKYQYSLGIAARTRSAILLGRILYPSKYRQALERRAAWQHTLEEVFRKVDFIALPTLETLPPIIPPSLKLGFLEALILNRQNTVAVNFAGNPALALPIPIHHGSIPVTSLQLIGPKYSEAELLNAGRMVETSNPRRHFPMMHL